MSKLFFYSILNYREYMKQSIVFKTYSIVLNATFNYIKEKTHQSHNVIGQVTGQVRGHKAGEAGQSHASVILIWTAKILMQTRKKKVTHTYPHTNETLDHDSVPSEANSQLAPRSFCWS